MNKQNKRWLLAAIVIWIALLVPFFLGAQAAHPATDDFTFAAYTRPTWLQTGSLPHVVKDAVSYALRTWRDWQGTVTGVILMALNPAVFSLEHYGAHAVVLLLLNLAAWLVFLRHMLVKRMQLPGRVLWPLFLAMSAIQLVFLPDIVEGVYWFNGAWFYTGAQAVALLTLVLCDALSTSCAGKGKTAVHAVVCCVLLFALGMDNYITAMMTAAALLMMALQRAWAAYRTPAAGTIGVIIREPEGWKAKDERSVGGPVEKARSVRAAKRTALMLIPIGAGLLLSVIAPGNSVRMATDGAHQSGMGWLIASIGWTLQGALGYIARFLLKTPTLALLAAATPFLVREVNKLPQMARRRCPPIPLALLGAYLILCAMIIPHMYSSGYAGSGRVVNMYHDYVVLAAPIVWIMLLMRMKTDTLRRLGGKAGCRVCAGVCVAALALVLLGGQADNYVKLVRDQLDGTQDAYIAQFEREYALCEAGGAQDDVILPAWTVYTVTGKPTAYEDAAMWTNEAMANYFGVRSVRVISNE